MISVLLQLIDSRRPMIVTILAHFLAGALQGLALALLIPFLASFLVSGRPEPRWLIAVLVSVGAAMGASMIGSVTAFKVASFDVCGDLIRKVGSRVQDLPLGWFDANSAGRVTTATSTSISLLSHLPSIVLPKLGSMVGAALSLFLAALLYDWRIALAMAASLPVCALALRILARTVVREHEAQKEAIQELSTRTLEFARLQAVLRATDSLKEGWEPLNRAFVREHETTRRAGRAKGPAGSLFHAGIEASLLLAIGIAAFRVVGGALDASAFIALSLMAVRFAEPIGMLAFYVDPLHQARVALDDISSIVHAELLPEADDSDALEPVEPYDLDLEHVDFSYVEGSPVITDLDHPLPGRSITAIVGPSGSGKSTLARLIARFWDVDSGAVRVGGADVRSIANRRLMERVSMVFQDVYLFNATIEENIRIGRPGADDAEVARAAERAGLLEVIDRLPGGWKTVVGEGGCALSGGERQRVAIARAFLKDSPVLLLDEATSALDGLNEASVTTALAELSRGRSVLVIAHRLSTIRGADRILVLRDGRLEAVGSHEELYEAGGTYRQFWDDQSNVERWRITGSSDTRGRCTAPQEHPARTAKRPGGAVDELTPPGGSEWRPRQDSNLQPSD